MQPNCVPPPFCGRRSHHLILCVHTGAEMPLHDTAIIACSILVSTGKTQVFLLFFPQKSKSAKTPQIIAEMRAGHAKKDKKRRHKSVPSQRVKKGVLATNYTARHADRLPKRRVGFCILRAGAVQRYCPRAKDKKRKNRTVVRFFCFLCCFFI